MDSAFAITVLTRSAFIFNLHIMANTQYGISPAHLPLTVTIVKLLPPILNRNFPPLYEKDPKGLNLYFDFNNEQDVKTMAEGWITYNI